MEANELLRAQHEITSEREPEKRQAAIDQAYVEDLRFLDSEADVMGREAFSDRLQQILDGAPPDFVIEEVGPAYVGPDTRPALAVRPSGQPCHPRHGCTHTARRQGERCTRTRLELWRISMTFKTLGRSP
jgi:hypothetical protein